MGTGRKLITLMIASSVGLGFSMVGCSNPKSEEEKNAENEIRKLLQYDANINISKEIVENNGFKLDKEIEGNSYLLSFRTTIYRSAGRTAILVDHDIITYSVDKDTYYDFCENYNTTETTNEVNMVTELTLTYNPVKVIEAGKEVEINLNLENN